MNQRRPLIFWLLLAATICIDAVAFSPARWSSTVANVEVDDFHPAICDALIASQLGIVCIWAVLGTSRLLWSPVLSALLAAVIVASLCEASTDGFLSACRMFFSLYGLETACLLTGLWFMRGLHYWRQRTGGTGWRFSVAQLLLVMTAAAVLATTLRTGPFADEGKWSNIAFALSVVAMSLASAVFWSFASHWLLRFATTLGVALVLGSLFSYFSPDLGPPGAYVIGSHFLVQAIVLSAWLGWGLILPERVSGQNFDDCRQAQLEN